MVGVGRAKELKEETLFTQTTVHDCFATKYWPHVLILGTELPAYCLLLISCERLLLVLRPLDYTRVFGKVSKCRRLLIVPFAGVVSILAAFLSAYQDGERIVETQHCFIIDSTAAWHVSYYVCCTYVLRI
ncbi:hypothetical protein Y032_0005g2478 [Ancylostoma ceylanicum]|uniref:G-protein coupled receptors family 1 profile domain-containing protein n=1 Tax=Ancylostoma ceylanicum TaxID=53326 RepID=A0A016VTT0_9BILA|nr:hypothetical protein Y032_0005g2478 [Ancylostoma ceylanicum]